MTRQLTLKDQISQAIKPRFIELTDKKTFEQELSFALQHIERNPVLKKATIESNIMAVLNIAQTGMTLNPVKKEAYLVPRFADGQIQTVLEPSYMGYCQMIIKTGAAKQIYSHPVYEGDEFEVTLGMKMEVIHKPKFQSKELTHVYMVALFPDGGSHVEVMTREDIDNIMQRSESYKAYEAKKIKSCPWVTDYTEMARKTVIRRGIKYIPKTKQWEQVARMIELDESDYKASINQINAVESLLMTAAIDDSEQNSIYREIASMTAQRAVELIEYLRENQVDPISSGHNYSQGDIQSKLELEQ